MHSVVVLLLTSLPSSLGLPWFPFSSSFSSSSVFSLFSHYIFYKQPPIPSAVCSFSPFFSHSFRVYLNAVLPSHRNFGLPRLIFFPFSGYLLSFSLPSICPAHLSSLHRLFLPNYFRKPAPSPVSFSVSAIVANTRAENLHFKFNQRDMRLFPIIPSTFLQAFAPIVILTVTGTSYREFIKKKNYTQQR